MAENIIDLASSKGKQKRSFDMTFKKEVVAYANSNSNRAAVSYYNVEPKRVREWKKDLDKLTSMKPKRKRLDGGGRKCVDEDMDQAIVDWIYEQRNKMLHVSRRMIMWKAKTLFDEKNNDPAVKNTFIASRGWCEKFMRRHGFSLRRKTTTAQKDPAEMIERIVGFVMHLRRLEKQYDFKECDIIAMDETPVWSDMVSNTTVEKNWRQRSCIKNNGKREGTCYCLLSCEGRWN